MARTITLDQMLDLLPKQDRSKEIAYYTSLGRFIHRFAGVETCLQVMLVKMAGVDATTARAVFSGVRMDAAISHIGRIFQARHLDVPGPIEDAFVQLGVINRARNDIVHFGAVFEDGIPKIVTNARSAHIAKKLYEFPVSPKLLDQMHEDLGTIILRVLAFNTRPADGDARIHDAAFAEVMQRPWLYKHAQRGGSQQKSRLPGRKRKGQPQPSPS